MSIIKSIVQGLLRWAARRQLAACQPMIVGVTGSSGKTSTKEAIGYVLAKVLTDRFVVVGSENLNTEFGLPLVVLGLPKPEGRLAWLRTATTALARGAFPAQRKQPVVLVLEYGVEQPGDMKTLVAIARPTLAVVTNVGEAHTQFLGSVANVAREKGQLVRALPASGLAVLNGSDDRVRAMQDLTTAQSVLIRAAPADLSVELAVAVAERGFGIPVAVARRALKDWERPTGRLRLYPGLRSSTILDDTYNANPLSMTLALSELKRLGAERRAERRIAVLGDMLELGEEENRVHTGVALLAETAADLVILVGPRFRRTQRGTWFPGPLPAAEHLRGLVAPGDLVLVKGSQSMRMEKVVEAILDPSLDPTQSLVRQTSAWKQKPYVAP
ncbi:UDP-N-acetylmuramoyl-tripeptide--D-alanyl-D-alanine ligase [Candidatus Berkelbacteria bacterium]|nr:UDP-N-acetylmuramoyl-tripeptide--D-alanyl-D-alanine ligase [Candidatus Berkelbacteria bacterium]